MKTIIENIFDTVLSIGNGLYKSNNIGFKKNKQKKEKGIEEVKKGDWVIGRDYKIVSTTNGQVSEKSFVNNILKNNDKSFPPFEAKLVTDLMDTPKYKRVKIGNNWVGIQSLRLASKEEIKTVRCKEAVIKFMGEKVNKFKGEITKEIVNNWLTEFSTQNL